ncbi:helix-turn-helix transcriptional regulator [Paractinoplanes atraurantiacus]|uniref:Regulatory protein, luxR family n=1 Tax=Paractinoplanes atraurantiacus TaxID=1036182 RepID=A0A285JTV2_9ACTN|nr:LuxR family transcriptional regulator [Actinoplanes atraurantiacus]SNY62746.1 regulatory protein, luxR family [Actinoplanes atraurantiacus]
MSGTGLVNRVAERADLDDMMAALRRGESRVLVLHGAAGIGKSALIGYAGRAASGIRVLRAAGYESEMELAFAALHQLCLPLLDRLPLVPAPRREALETVFRMRDGAPPDPFLVGLATLDLLSGASEQQPLLGLVDDAQWLDRASAQVLGFVARRLLAESVGVLFAAREPVPELRGLPEREVTGLTGADAHLLLGSVAPGPLDPHIRDRIVAETHGNPLALIELPRGLTALQMAGGLGLLHAEALPGRLDRSFAERVRDLTGPARLLLLVAAAEPVGDPHLVRRAAESLGVPFDADGTGGLLVIGTRVTFRHPLARTAVYRSASAEDRRTVHRALAEVTDPHDAADRRAWHLSAAADWPDEPVAAELERSAGRARARGGLAAAAAFLQRSVALTGDRSRHADRVLAAAETSFQAGEAEQANALLGALDGPLDDFQRGRSGVLSGQIAFAGGAGTAAIPMLLGAARSFAAVDPRRAREACLQAWVMANLAADRDSFVAVARTVRAIPVAGPTGPLDLIVDGLALLVTDGWAAAATTLREAVRVIGDIPADEMLRWGWLATAACGAIWDVEGIRAEGLRQVRVAREAGALQVLPYCLATLGYALTWTGEFDAAGAAIAESELVSAAIGSPAPPFTDLRLLSLRGRETETAGLIAATRQSAAASGFGSGVTTAGWAGAVLYNGLARYPEAMRAALDAERHWEPFGSTWLLPDLVEAASRSGEPEIARDALGRLVAATEPFGTDVAAGLRARTRALLADGDEAESLYREAVERLGRTRLRPELARAHLLYGEWLRRRRQRMEAREQLRLAYEMFTAIGMEAFTERARRELLATGENVQRAAASTPGATLTAQERQIAILVRDGCSNAEVGERLFISPRTVEWHLRKVFAKLSIASRRQLRDVLPAGGVTG